MFALFDAHCDTANCLCAWGAYRQNRSLRQNDCQTDLCRGAAYVPRGQVYALWQEGQGLSANELQCRFRWMLEHFLCEAEKNCDVLALCTSYEELRAAFGEKKQAALLSVEGAELFGCGLSGLERVRQKGVRIVHLCWNDDNALCGAAAGSGSGLTDQGRTFVRACGELGICIDLSHASDQTAWDVLELNCTPVLASHSNCRRLCDVPRNLPDDLLRAVAAAGGVVGLNLYPPFLGGRSLSLAKAHVNHMLELCGDKNVCLGCDFDGVDDLPVGINGIENMSLLRSSLGLPEDTLNDIFFNNLMNFWERAL